MSSSPTPRAQPARPGSGRAGRGAAAEGASPEAVTAFLSEFPPGIRACALEVREVVLGAIPTALERVLPGWRALGYRDAQAGHFCALFPYESRVRLYLEHGAALAARGRDPEGLLQGEATMRRGRYVEFVPGRALSAKRRRAVAALLVEVVTAASL